MVDMGECYCKFKLKDMREIKFRGKSTISGRWIYGYYVMHHGKHFICDGDGNDFIVDPKTVGQYTGLKDKNGKEVWEGDIMQVKNCIQQDEDSFYLSKDIVAFRSGGFYSTSRLNEWYTKNGDCLWEYLYVVKNASRESYHKQFDAEIIGNIHDDTELLNQLENK